MSITLSRCALRPWRPGDELSLVRHANDPEVARNLRDLFPHPYTSRDALDWIAFATQASPSTEFAIVVDGQAVGGIGLVIQPDIFRRSAEVGFWLGRAYWGRGIVSEALVAFTDYAFRTFDVVRLYAGVIEWNVGSCRVLEKAGFTLEARLKQAITKAGRTVDEFLYAKIKD